MVTLPAAFSDNKWRVMTNRKKLKQLIALHEGLELTPYRCPSNKLSIGYGRNLEDRGISKSEADFMMINDIDAAEHELAVNVNCYQFLSHVRRAVLIDMLYNMGWPTLSQFKRFFAALDQKDYSTAAEEMLDSRWAGQVKTRSSRLAVMMSTGEWPEEL